MIDDRAQRFLFNRTDIRGELVQLHSAYTDVLRANPYHPTVQALLGEFLAASLLLSATIKFHGRLVLQMRSEGDIPMLMAEASHDKQVRGLIRPRDETGPVSGDFAQLFHNGTLAVTVENDDGQRYQSLVPIAGNSLAECLVSYFEQSEQLGTCIYLAAGEERAAGMLLQQLPAQLVTDAGNRQEQWNEVNILANTITAEELREVDATDLLRHLFADLDVQLAARDVISFECSCSRERIGTSLTSLADEELDSLFTDEPVITVDCEFCAAHYQFSREDLRT